ncbi:MAG: tripartite tricarboxylate transporter TctB family protein [Rhodospirillales bacterium]
MEIGVAALMAIFALIVIAGSLDVGIGWAIEGPQSGFIPFYLGLFILGASIVNFARALMSGAAGKAGRLFADWGQLRQVASVVAPTAVYVAVVPFVGFYVASALLIGVFMKWLGRYGWQLVAPVAIGVPILAYFAFEQWFLVPLPKGPIEDYFNL